MRISEGRRGKEWKVSGGDILRVGGWIGIDVRLRNRRFALPFILQSGGN